MDKDLIKKNWFKNWFNSPYYHILYKNRDENEAEKFISNLIDYLHPKSESLLLDAACGKGRHAVYMNKLGYRVDAFDLSENSINFAKKYENDNLHFYINDIRSSLKINKYDYIFNLFTSFGYFSEEKDNYRAINAIAESLNENGVFIMDFMNVDKIINGLVTQEEKKISDINFNISREVKNGFIVKHIEFTDQEEKYHYTENVKAISLTDFIQYFNDSGLKLTTTFGDYDLSPFDIEKSDRLIMVVKK